MTTVNAKLVKGWPCCPECGYQYVVGTWENYGYNEAKGGYWYTFKCPICSKANKKGVATKKLFIKYYSDPNFNLIQRRVSS